MAESLFFLRVNVMPGDLSCCDKQELFHSFTICKVPSSLKGLPLPSGRKDASSLVLVVTFGVQMGGPAGERTALPWGQTTPSPAVPEEEAGCAGLRWEAQGWLKASSMGWRCACPQRSSGQTHRLVSAMRTVTEFIWGHRGNACNLLHPREPLNIPELRGDWGKGSTPAPLQWHSRQGDREKFAFILSFPADWNFCCSKSVFVSVCSQIKSSFRV